jgi:AbrB family transcriptional regulator, transcriptional pleiotropic regulator of transition state genes
MGFAAISNGHQDPMAAASNSRNQPRTGVVRHIDELGRIVIPSEIRKRFGFGDKDPVEITVKGDTILLSRPQAACVFCGRDERLNEHRGRLVCAPCVTELSGAAA